MESCEPFDVIVVPFPFTDKAASKRRPALVLSAAAFSSATGHIVLAMITTASFSSWASDVALRDWKAAGLPKASLVRMKLFTLDMRFVLRKLGSLSAHDRKRVIGSLHGVLPPMADS